MLYRQINDDFAVWLGEPIADVHHSLSIEASWTDEALAAFGLYRADEPPVPAGHIVTKRTLALVDGRLMISIETAAAPVEPAPLLPLTARQLRLGLLKIGIKPADVAAAIAGLPADQRDAAEIEWDYASEYRRDHPLIATLGDSFGLSADQIDAAWRDAMAL